MRGSLGQEPFLGHGWEQGEAAPCRSHQRCWPWAGAVEFQPRGAGAERRNPARSVPEGSCAQGRRGRNWDGPDPARVLWAHAEPAARNPAQEQRPLPARPAGSAGSAQGSAPGSQTGALCPGRQEGSEKFLPARSPASGAESWPAPSALGRSLWSPKVTFRRLQLCSGNASWDVLSCPVPCVALASSDNRASLQPSSPSQAPRDPRRNRQAPSAQIRPPQHPGQHRGRGMGKNCLGSSLGLECPDASQ